MDNMKLNRTTLGQQRGGCGEAELVWPATELTMTSAILLAKLLLAQHPSCIDWRQGLADYQQLPTAQTQSLVLKK
jgi:mannose/cellobiose epimerase-like protein (N-acyl-D-glucosamine 2-epimerase family)